MGAQLRLARAAVLLATLSPGLVGCGSTGPSGPLADNPQPSPTVSPAPTAPQFGQSVAAGTGFIAATVFSYTQPAAGGAAPSQAGHVWAAVDAQACREPGSVFQVTVSNAPWSLRFSDGTATVPSLADDPHFPQPRYPDTPTALQPGQCLRGWIVFDVPAAGRPLAVRYAPQGGSPIDWPIP